MDQSLDNVTQLMQSLVIFRKQVPSNVFEVNSKATRETLEYINRIKINLHTLKVSCEIPDSIFEKVQIDNYSDYMCNRNIYEQMKLLDILKPKKNCSISKIVDAI